MKQFRTFLPLLALYLLLVLLFSKNTLADDEVRYNMFAENLVNGFYTEYDNPNLISPPGHPLYLAIFIKLGLPPIAPRIGNVLFVFFGVFFLYKTLLFFSPPKFATILAYGFGLYYPMLEWLWLNFSESFSIFLLCTFIYTSFKLLRSNKPRVLDYVIPGLCIGYLVLVKAIFGYVILAALLLAVLYFALFRTPKGLRSIIVLVVSFLVTLPYLIYTYSLTGRVLYWGSNGGEQLYWMTTHYEEEYGSWVESTTVLRRGIPQMHPSHFAFYDSVYTKPWVEMNDLFMKQAIENIKQNPKAYFYNVIANTLRLIADGPYSYQHQSLRTYLYLFINLILLVPLLISLYPAWLHRRKIPFELIGLCVFILFYLGASILLCAVARYFIMVVPFIFLWLGFIYSAFVQISFRNNTESNIIRSATPIPVAETSE